MNPKLAQIGAAIKKNKVALGALGAAAVAALAWRARSGSTDAAAPASSGAASTSPAYYSTGGQVAGASGYDSTSSDVYNAIQPQLEELRRLWETNNNTPVPVPGPVDIDPRRQAISGLYQSILGRAPDLQGLRYWDKTGYDLETIKTRIENSREAKALK